MGDGGVAQHDLALPPGVRWALGGVSAAVVGLFALVLAHQWQVDFEVYRTGGQHVLGTGLYSAQVKGADRTLLFTYTPLAALAFWPFSFVSTWAGQVVWDVLNIAALAALVAVSSAAARRRPPQRSDWQLGLLALAPLSLLVWPVRYGFELGQINVVLVLAIVADLTMDISWGRRRLPRGVLVGLAAAVKLTPLVFIPYLLVTRRWATARNAVLTFCAATGVMFAAAPAGLEELLRTGRPRPPAHRRQLDDGQPDAPGGSGAHGPPDPPRRRRRRPGGRPLCRAGARGGGVSSVVGVAGDAAVRRHRAAGVPDLVAAPLRVVRAAAGLARLRDRRAEARSGVGRRGSARLRRDASGSLH